VHAGSIIQAQSEELDRESSIEPSITLTGMSTTRVREPPYVPESVLGRVGDLLEYVQLTDEDGTFRAQAKAVGKLVKELKRSNVSRVASGLQELRLY